MNIKNFNFDNLKTFLTSAKLLYFTVFLLYVTLLTVTVSSQNFFYKSIIENGISKKDIIAQKTITVVDADKTEQRKKV